MNILVEGRERFRLIDLTSGRSFQTGDVDPARRCRRSGRRRSRSSARASSSSTFASSPSSEVEVPRAGHASALLRARRARRARRGGQAGASRGDVRDESGWNASASFSKTPRPPSSGTAAPPSAQRRTARSTSAERCRERWRQRRGTMRGGRNSDPKLDAHRLRADFADLRASSQREAARVPRLGASSTQKPRQMLDAMREFYETRTRTSTGASMPRRARNRGLRGCAARRSRLRERAVRARDHLHSQRDRGAQPRRLRLGPRQPRARATSSSSPSSSTTRTSSPGSTSPSAPARASA